VPRLAHLRWLQGWRKKQRVRFETQRKQVDRSRQTRTGKSPSPSRRIGVVSAICLASFLVCSPSSTQNPTPVPKTALSVFVFLIRTENHVKYSSPQVFEEVVDDVYGYLECKRVYLAIDEFGGRRTSTEDIPLESVQKIARSSGAESLLLMMVDRPATKWIRVEAKCYGASGRLLWSFQADSGSSITGPITGKAGLRAALKTLHKRLDEHIGKEGLPVRPEAEQMTTGPGNGEREKKE